ncbi:hypothetical protein FH063_003001 [Azospirillum argentinense]|uniref:Uncharacterized protein n=1 Tax=Azospirillum argentinense TaxID=2970906 RepID=A0A5B0KKB6_9PROT|nr:hypothetical protein FH063_003001 [Azospirillum argentinense]
MPRLQAQGPHGGVGVKTTEGRPVDHGSGRRRRLNDGPEHPRTILSRCAVLVGCAPSTRCKHLRHVRQHPVPPDTLIIYCFRIVRQRSQPHQRKRPARP